MQDKLTSFLADFLARTSALREKWKAYTAKGAGCGSTCCELYGRFDPNTSCWKTAQLSLFEDSNTSYNRFPKKGMMRNGNVFRIYNSDFRIIVKDYTLLPTPIHSDAKAGIYRNSVLLKLFLEKNQKRMNYLAQLKGFTPCQTLSIYAAMMGFPDGHTIWECTEMP